MASSMGLSSEINASHAHGGLAVVAPWMPLLAHGPAGARGEVCAARAIPKVQAGDCAFVQ